MTDLEFYLPPLILNSKFKMEAKWVSSEVAEKIEKGSSSAYVEWWINLIFPEAYQGPISFAEDAALMDEYILCHRTSLARGNESIPLLIGKPTDRVKKATKISGHACKERSRSEKHELVPKPVRPSTTPQRCTPPHEKLTIYKSRAVSGPTWLLLRWPCKLWLSFDSVAVIACSSATAIAGLFFRYQLGTRPDSSPDGQNWLAHGERPLDPAWDRHESKSHDATVLICFLMAMADPVLTLPLT